MKKLLTFLISVIFAFGVVNETNAQVNYFQGWEDAGAGLAGWTNTGTGGTFARNTSFPCTGLASVRANIYVAGNVRNFVSPLLGTSNGGLTTVTFDYKVVDYYNPGTTGALCSHFTIGVEWATSIAGTWNPIGLIDCDNHVVSASCAAGPGTYQFTPVANDNVYIRFVVTRLTGDNFYYFDNVSVQEEVPPCTGTPIPGNTLSSSNPVCSGVNFTLSLENTTPGSGVTYQWQSSPDGNDPWTDLGTAATQVTSQTAATYYRSEVTCDGNTGTSNPLQVNMFLPVTSFTENFDGAVAPAFPGCWAKVGTLGSASTQTTSANSLPNCLYIYSSSSTSRAVVKMDEISNLGAGTHQFRFNMRAYFTVGGVVEFGYLTNPNDAATFVSLGSATASTLTYAEYTIIPVAGSYSTYPAIRHTGVPANSLLIDDVKWELLPTCLPPASLNVSGITQNAADLGWTSVDSFFDVFIELSPGTPPGPSTPPTAGLDNISNPVTWAGGSPASTYVWWVRTDCDPGNNNTDVSEWAGPHSFTTLLCDPADQCTYTVMLYDSYGDGWDGTVLGFRQNGTVVATFGQGFNSGSSFGPVDADLCDGLVTEIMVVNVGSYVGEKGFTVYDPFGVEIFNWPFGGTFNASTVFHTYTSNCTPPACPTPTALNATDITTSSATLNWTSAETLFNVKYNEGVDFDPDSDGTAVTPDPTTNSAPISGLTAATTVYWYVRADCGTKAVSTWAGPHSFSTLLANDLCVDAIDIFCDDIVNGSTVGSAFDNVGDCGTTNTSGGVWYKFAGIGETVIASLEGSAYDTKLSIFEGDCNNLVCVWGNDDFPGIGLHSRVDWYSQSGVDYYILVHGYSSSTGSFTLTLTCSPALTSTWSGSSFPYRWTDARNWDNGVPGTTTDAVIPAGLTNYPTVLRVNMCDDIFLGSNASRTATLLDNGFLTVNGTATVERYYGAPSWHLISSPIADGQAGMYTGMYLQEYLEPTDSWNDIVAVTHPLTPVQGFALWVDAPYTAVYQGTLNTGNQLNIFSEAGPDPFHWQLFGNPYPSGLNWDLVVPANLGLMSGAVYYLDAVSGNYLSYNGGMGGGSQFVPPMQGFFISGLPACGGSPFTLDNSMRTHSGNNIYYKSEFSNMLVLTAQGNDLSDKTYIRFEEEATEQFDHQYDAYKLFSWANPILPQLYTIGEFNQSINVLPETNAILAGFRSGVDGTFTISIDEMNGMSHVILEDLFTGELTNLLEGNHIFNYNTSDIDERFIIHFAPLSVGDNAARNVNIWSYGNEVIMMVPELTNGQVKVYNMMGQEVVSSSVTSGRNVITVPQPGNYVVTLISNEVVRTEKVVIK